jgi:hypothetical protein
MIWEEGDNKLKCSGIEFMYTQHEPRMREICQYGCANCFSSQRASVASYGYVPSSMILVTLMMEALSSSETSVFIEVTQRNIPEDAILSA